MCDGVSSTALQVAGAYQTAVGDYYAAKGDKRALETKASIADLESRLSDLRAEGELLHGQKKEQASRMQTRQITDRATTGYAGNNVALDSETVARVISSSEVLGEIEANTIDANAARAAWGHRTDAVMSKNEALFARAGAAGIDPRAAATTSLLGSAGNISRSFVKFNNAGEFDNVKGLFKGGRS